jgi:hypothetical protein
LALSGCDSGQIGGDVGLGNGQETAGGWCEDANSVTVGVDDVIDDTSLVLSDLIAAIEGTHTEDLKWGPSGSQYVTLSPEAGETSITVDVEVLPETGRWVTRQQKQSSSGEELVLDFAECESELRVDAHVMIATENGALNDTFEATFVTKDGSLASTRIDVDPGELTGSFDVAVSGLENGKASQTGLDLSFAFGQMSGKLSGVVESNNGEVAMASSTEYARFPIENRCTSGVQVPDNSAIVTQLKDAMEAHTAFNFSWQGEGVIEMDFTPTLGTVCFESSGSPTESNFLANLSLVVTTSDDSISGTWPLAVRGESEGGDLVRIAVFRDAYLAYTYPASKFEAKTGITGVESSAEEMSYSFGYNIELSGDTPASGELTILAINVPDCAKPGYVAPVETTPGGEMGTPGCSGTDAREIKNASLVER